MKHKIFITRDIDFSDDSSEIPDVGGNHLFGDSMMQIEGIYFSKFPMTEWIFFYSKNGVKHFLEGISDDDQVRILQSSKLAAIGPGTGKLTEELFGKCDFVGNGKPEETAKQFLIHAHGCTVLFPQAEESRQSVQKMLSGSIEDYSLPVYRSRSKEPDELPESVNAHIIIFTSPKKAEFFLDNYDLDDGQAVIAIGNTTAETLQDKGLWNITVAHEPTPRGLSKAVMFILEKRLHWERHSRES